MKLRNLFPAVLLTFVSPAMALPPPPPAPAEQAKIDSFFAALPRQLPAEDLPAFEPFVAPNVEVWRDGERVHSDRTAWFAELAKNPFAGWQSPKPPVAGAIGRDDFYRRATGEIIVRELTTARAPEGEQIIYHLGYNLRLVTYTLADGILTKVDYGYGMDRLNPPGPYRNR